LVVFLLAVIAGVGVYWLAYQMKGPASQQARERIDQANAQATQYLQEESARWGQRLEELKTRLSEMAQPSSGDEATSEGLQGRIEDFKDALARYEQEFGPAYREKLLNWQKKAEEALLAAKNQSGDTGSKLRSILKELRTASGNGPAAPSRIVEATPAPEARTEMTRTAKPAPLAAEATGRPEATPPAAFKIPPEVEWLKPFSTPPPMPAQ